MFGLAGQALGAGRAHEVLTWGRQGSANGEFERPDGVATGPGGLVHVADTKNDHNRIVKYAQG